MIAVESLIKTEPLTTVARNRLLGVFDDSELPTQLRLLTKAEAVEREGFYDDEQDIWQSPANDRKIFATPCYPSTGGSEIEEC